MNRKPRIRLPALGCSPILRFPDSSIRPFAAEAGVLLAYVILTAVMTYPVAFRLSATEDPGDPLFIAWTIFWVQHQLFTDPLHLFDANIFSPYVKTLAFSEHMIGSAILALPFRLLTDNPIVVYNVSALLAFILSGYGTYRLALHLTGNRAAAFIAGAIFAFTPFRTYQFGHLHVMNTQWVPFAALSLIRVFETRGAAVPLAGLVVFSLLQVLSSGSHAPFFLILMGVLAVVLFVRHGTSVLLPGFFLRIGGAAFVIALVLLPLWLVYHSVQLDHSFRTSRPPDVYSASPMSYLAAPPGNRLYGGVLERFGHFESHLFPGAVPIILAALALVPRRRRPAGPDGPDPESWKADLLDGAVVLSFVALVFTIFFGGLQVSLGVRVTVKSPAATWLVFIGLIVFRRLLQGSRPFLGRFVLRSDLTLVWLVLLLLAVSLSYGAYGPGEKIYDRIASVVPGLGFLRVPARIGIFVPFFLALLSASALARLAGRLSPRPLFAAALLLVLAESASFPLASHAMPDRAGIYERLAEASGPGAVVHWPVPNEDNWEFDIPRQYFSIVHWRPILTGYSGFKPPGYHVVQDALADFPDESSIRFLQGVGIRFVVVHGEVLPPDAADRVRRDIGKESRLALLERDGPVALYELASAPPVRSAETTDAGREIPREDWRVSGSAGGTPTEAAIDGRRETAWDSGHPQRPGDFFEVDMGKTYTLSRIEIPMGASVAEFPRGLRILVSGDGTRWREVSAANSPRAEYLLQAARTPRDVRFRVFLPSVEARFVRLEVTRPDPRYAWRIPELRFYR